MSLFAGPRLAGLESVLEIVFDRVSHFITHSGLKPTVMTLLDDPTEGWVCPTMCNLKSVFYREPTECVRGG